MRLIELNDGWAISTLDADGDGMGTITFSENLVTKGLVLVDAKQLAEIICELKRVYLSMAGYGE